MATVAATGLLFLVVGPVSAETLAHSGTLVAGGTLKWAGHFGASVVPVPELCVVPGTCDTFELSVALGDGYWQAHPGSVQIGIQWRDDTMAESESEYDYLDLYVYDGNGFLIASSTTPRVSSAGIASSAQVVSVPSAADGAYNVVVVPTNVGTDRSYRGLVMVQSSVPAHEGKLLPDLVALQPTNFKLAIGTLSFTRAGTDAMSCYPDETIQDPTHPTRCLRFDAAHANFGEGAFLMDIDLATAVPTMGDFGPTLGGTVQQAYEGTTKTTFAGPYAFHAEHGHIHYKNFALYELRAADGRLVSPAHKSDFCLIDVDDLWFGRPGNQSRTHRFPNCNIGDADALPGKVVQRQGINRGWADVYTWDLPGQYIDITNVPDGVYDVVNIVNPFGVLHDMTKANDRAVTRISLQNGTVSCIPVPYGCPIGT
jgi:hypothetical protein